MFAPNYATIASQTGVNASTWTGPTKTLSFADASQFGSAGVVLLWKLTQTGGATSPTCTLYVDLSADGTNWYRQQIPGASTDATETVQGIQTIDVLTRYARVVLVLTGGTLPTIDVLAQIASAQSITVS